MPGASVLRGGCRQMYRLLSGDYHAAAPRALVPDAPDPAVEEHPANGLPGKTRKRRKRRNDTGGTPGCLVRACSRPSFRSEPCPGTCGMPPDLMPGLLLADQSDLSR